MKTEAFSALAAKLALGVATAATLAGATSIIASAQTNAVQDLRLERVESTVEKIDELNTNLHETSEEVALLRQELEASRDARD